MTAKQECQDPMGYIDLGVEYLNYTLNRDTNHVSTSPNCAGEPTGKGF